MRRAQNPRRTRSIVVGSIPTRGTYQYRQICKLVKQAVCKTVAFGPCRFKSCSADFMPQSLNRRRRCLENSWSGKTGLRVRIPPVAFYLRRRALTGRHPVPKTGNPFGSGGSSPPASAHKPLWQNWQMHLPAKQESDHSGIRGRDPGAVLRRGILCFPGCFHVIISDFFIAAAFNRDRLPLPRHTIHTGSNGHGPYLPG